MLFLDICDSKVKGPPSRQYQKPGAVERGRLNEIPEVLRVRSRPRRPADCCPKLQRKIITSFVLRHKLRCAICSPGGNFPPYHSPTSLNLHRMWRHSLNRFSCEHCPHKFRHRYQVILHASTKHLPSRHTEPPIPTTSQLTDDNS